MNQNIWPISHFVYFTTYYNNLDFVFVNPRASINELLILSLKTNNNFAVQSS